MITESGEMGEFILRLLTYMVLMSAIAVIYLSVIMPCVFYWGTIKAKYVLMGIYIMIFIGASNINLITLRKIGESFHGYLSGHGILLIVAVICFSVSISISLRIWEKRDVK